MKTSVDKIFCEYDEEASAFSSSSFENYFLWVSDLVNQENGNIIL